VRAVIEIAHPTADNDFIDVVSKVPPELRMRHRIFRKFILKLSRELAEIPYNQNMIRPSAPLFHWRVGFVYLYIKELIKKKIWRLSKGHVFLRNKRSCVNFDEWFRVDEKWQKFFKELLLNKESQCQKFMNEKYLKQLVSNQISGRRDNSLKLLHIATLEIFLRQFFANR